MILKRLQKKIIILVLSFIDGCLGRFKCRNGHCIDPDLHCNTHDDCGDLSDEEECGKMFTFCLSNIDLTITYLILNVRTSFI